MSADSHDTTFDDVASSYDAELERGLSLTGEHKDYYATQRVARIRALIQDGTIRAPERIVDYGCGIGDTMELLAGIGDGCRLCGVDTSSKSLAIARERVPSADFLLPDDFQSASPFDLCYCNGVFHHIPVDERPRFASIISGRLRPGGTFAFYENNPLNPGTRMVMKRIPFDRDAVMLPPWQATRLLQSAGLEVVRVEYLFFFPKALRQLRPVEYYLRSVPLGGQYLILARRTEGSPCRGGTAANQPPGSSSH